MNDGEKLIGHFVSANGKAVTFKSDLAGLVTVPWSAVQSLKAPEKFFVLDKGMMLQGRGNGDASQVPQGNIEVENQKIAVTAAAAQPKEVPLSEVANVVSNESFQRALHKRNLLEGWKGMATFGASWFQGAAKSQIYSSSVSLSRTDTGEPWQQVHSRTSFFFNQSYSNLGIAVNRISVVHAELTHDHYINQKFFVFAGAQWDHNYTQSLELLQAYGAGAGLVAFKTDRAELDLRAGIGYVHQSYDQYPGISTPQPNLLGSRFNETYTRTFPRGIVFTETAGIRPAWNAPKNFFMGYTASLNVPVYKRLSFNASSFDQYTNNPPPYITSKNVNQIALGFSYQFK